MYQFSFRGGGADARLLERSRNCELRKPNDSIMTLATQLGLLEVELITLPL